MRSAAKMRATDADGNVAIPVYAKSDSSVIVTSTHAGRLGEVGPLDDDSGQLFSEKGECMGFEDRAKQLGIEFTDDAPQAYLNMAARIGDTIYTSGHVSTQKGKLGADVTVEQGYAAAKEVAIAILKSVHQEVGSLDNLRVVKLFGCVNSTLDFTDQHLVINGASDLLHEIFGKQGRGFHARSAVGFAQLPTGVAVEIEAVFSVEP